MRNTLLALKIVSIAGALAWLRPASAGEEAPAPTATSVPRAGEALRKLDWNSFFEPGDGWKKFEQVFVWNNDTEPETLDPAVMTGVTEHNLAMAMFEGLTTLHPKTLQPVPGTAEWWDVSADGKTYTFHLRKDLKWSNGDPFTSEDIRWSWERALTPKTGCKYAEMFYPISGAEAFYTDGVAGKPVAWSSVGVEVPDALTIRVTLKEPTPYFLELAAFETLLPVHRASVTKLGDKWTEPGNLVSNGPFMLEKWLKRDRIEVVLNPHWWNRGIVRLDRMVIRATADVNTTYNEYLNGKVDWIRSVGAAKVEEAQANPDYYVAPYLGTYFFRFNVTKKPFDDVRVRKALNYAVDKKAICETVLKAGQVPATGVVPPGIAGFPEFKGLPYDPKKARELLAEAGFPEGKGFPEFELLYNTRDDHKQVCEQMVEMWKTTLGVKARLENREWQIYLKDTHSMNYTVVRSAWIADYADPSTFLEMWRKDRGNNNTGWSNPRYEELMEKSIAESDPVKRFVHLADAEKILCAEDLPILPLYYYVNQGMLRPRVRGWHDNVRDMHPFQYIYIDGPAAGK